MHVFQNVGAFEKKSTSKFSWRTFLRRPPTRARSDLPRRALTYDHDVSTTRRFRAAGGPGTSHGRGGDDGLYVTVGDHFRGAIMPVRLG